MTYSILILAFVLNLFQEESEIRVAPGITGAWQSKTIDGKTGLWIITKEHFSITYYKTEPAEFLYTEGGKWSINEKNKMEFIWEYHTTKKELVGQIKTHNVILDGKTIKVADAVWTQVNDGTRGVLQGAWLITGRMRDGEVKSRQPGARKTMKILSASKFQWIAYNSETGDFFGTGGGSYTTVGGRYTEIIEFFSRDNS